MNRAWIFWAPFVLFVICGAVLGLRYGAAVAQIDESDVIEDYAARYLAERGEAGESGAKLSDCAGQPGQQPGVWLVVICEGHAGSGDGTAKRSVGGRIEYHVNRMGGLEFIGGAQGGLAPGRPQT